MSKTIKVQLDEVIFVDGNKIESVEMRVPKVKDLKNVSHLTDDVDKELTLISNLCGLTATLDEMYEWSVPSYMQLQKVLQDLL